MVLGDQFRNVDLWGTHLDAFSMEMLLVFAMKCFKNYVFFLPCSYHYIFVKLAPDIDLMKCLWHMWFQVKRSKVTGVIWSFCHVLCVSMPIWQICFILGTIIVHNMTMCHNFQVKLGPRSRSHWSFQLKVTLVIWSFCRVCSVASSLFDWFTSYVAYIQHMTGDVSHHSCHSQDERSKVKVTWVVSSFGPVRSVASTLFDRIT